MNEGLIPRRYAKALYKVSEERKDSPAIYRLMNILSNAFENCPDLEKTVSNPFVADKDKEILLRTAAGLDKDKPEDTPVVNATFDDFLKLLVKNGRISMSRSIASEYCKIFREQRNIHKVKIVTAAQLPQATMDKIIDMASKYIDGGEMELTRSVDPELIGGFTVDIDNRRLDASVNTELKKLRLNLIK